MPSPNPRTWRNLVIGFMAVTLAMMVQSYTLLAIPLISRDRGYALGATNLFLVAWAVTVLVVEYPLARISDRTGRRPFLIVGGACLALGGLMLGMGVRRWTIILALALLGVGFAASLTPGLAMVTELVTGPDLHLPIQAFNGAFQAIGLAVVPMVVAALYGTSPDLAVVVPGVACGIGLMLCAAMISDTSRRRVPAGSDTALLGPSTLPLRNVVVSLGRLGRNGAIQLAALITAVFTFCALFFGYAVAPLILATVFHRPATAVTELLGLRGVLSVAVCLLIVPLSARVPLKVLMYALAVGTLATMLALALARGSWPVACAAFVAQGAVLGLAAPLSNLLVTSGSSTGMRAQAFTLVAFSSRLTLIASPVLTALATSALSGEALLGVIAAIGTAACAFLLLRVRAFSLT